MKSWQSTQKFLALVAGLGMLMPSTAVFAQQPSTPNQIAPEIRVAPPLSNSNTTGAPMITDVALSDGGRLDGKVVDQMGTAVADAKLTIKSAERKLVETTTEKDGTFRVNALRGGVYELTANGNTTIMRLWQNQTAPPKAALAATVVTGPRVVRGQSCTSCTGTSNGCGCDDCAGGMFANSAFLMNPIVIGAAIAAAVAIPLALNDGDDETPGS